ncbi:MAG TPA: hypothetical protein DDZ81_18265 [Acetobacteraceae bacterium]|jgi:hypothetical protein|nr:hypothetical protein [Acetobacteraceae bacterium]
METQPQPSSPSFDLPARAYRHLIHTLIALLPPPITDTPEARLTRNHAAIARIAALAPVNANEAELAAQCIAARAQAEDVMRLIRLHADDIKLVIKLNAQYSAMVRTSLAAHSHLLREQQQRRKREATDNAADTDEWTRHVAAEAMLDAIPLQPQIPAAAPAEKPSKSSEKSHTTGHETPARRPSPQPATPASVSALITAALRAPDPRSAAQTWPTAGAARANNGIQRAAQQRSA